VKIAIKTPVTKEDFKNYYHLRYAVLREPWGQPRGSEKDDYEPISQHFYAVDEETGEMVGVIKLLEREPKVGWLSHLAVARDLQKKGIGRMLVQAGEDAARQKGYTSIGCLSRLNTTTYFEKLGYRVAGLPSHYFGTTQVVWMEKELV
jgi:predicted N-acetyltransferase YhbS